MPFERPLEVTCPRCKGDTVVMSAGKKKICPKCLGYGSVHQFFPIHFKSEGKHADTTPYGKSQRLRKDIS